MNQTINPYAAPQAIVSDLPGLSGPELAGRGSRLLASILDSLITGLPAALAGFVLALLVPRLGPGVIQQFETALSPLLAKFATAVLLILFYFAINIRLLAREGQTLGKRIVGIRIVRSDGSRADLRRLLLFRYLPVLALQSIPIPYLNLLTLVDVLFIFRQSRKCIHDDIADTIVVKV